MRVKYRRLTGKTDWSQVGAVMRDEAKQGGGLGGARGGSFAVAVANTPKIVQAEEHSAELDEVRTLVRQGWLRLTDLVDAGEGWTTIDDCPLFDEAAESQRRSSRLRWRLLLLGVFVAAVIAAVILVAR